MDNYTILRISRAGAFFLLFCAGTCFGGLCGIVLGIMERSMASLMAGMFFGLLFGTFSGLFGLIFATVFNLLAPVIGGLTVQLEPLDKPSTIAETGKKSEPRGPGY